MGLLAIRGVPWSLFNRAILPKPAGAVERDIPQAVGWLRRHAAPSWQLQLPPGDPAILAAVSALGLERRSAGMEKLVWDGQMPREEPRNEGVLRIEAVGPDRRTAFGEILDTGFGTPLPLGAAVSGVIGRPGWQVFMAFDGDEPIGTGSLFMSGAHA